MMESATRSVEPTFALPDSGPGDWCSPFSLPEQSKTRPEPLEEMSGGFGLKNETCSQYSAAGLSQVGPMIAGNGSPSGASLCGGETVREGAGLRSLGGQARSARPALGQCEHFSCDAEAVRVKTLNCGHRGEYCGEHAETAW